MDRIRLRPSNPEACSGKSKGVSGNKWKCARDISRTTGSGRRQKQLAATKPTRGREVLASRSPHLVYCLWRPASRGVLEAAMFVPSRRPGVFCLPLRPCEAALSPWASLLLHGTPAKAPPQQQTPPEVARVREEPSANADKFEKRKPRTEGALNETKKPNKGKNGRSSSAMESLRFVREQHGFGETRRRGGTDQVARREAP